MSKILTPGIDKACPNNGWVKYCPIHNVRMTFLIKPDWSEPLSWNCWKCEEELTETMKKPDNALRKARAKAA